MPRQWFCTLILRAIPRCDIGRAAGDARHDEMMGRCRYNYIGLPLDQTCAPRPRHAYMYLDRVDTRRRTRSGPRRHVQRVHRTALPIKRRTCKKRSNSFQKGRLGCHRTRDGLVGLARSRRVVSMQNAPLRHPSGAPVPVPAPRRRRQSPPLTITTPQPPWPCPSPSPSPIAPRPQTCPAAALASPHTLTHTSTPTPTPTAAPSCP
ncbi:hypothetical protein ACJQWK_11009 [Exserohilum turcicum]